MYLLTRDDIQELGSTGESVKTYPWGMNYGTHSHSFVSRNGKIFVVNGMGHVF